MLVSIAAYLGYLVAQLAVLALGRARELGADHFSCELTHDGDALCSALVKIAYGLGEVNAERARKVRELIQNKQRKAARKLQRTGHRFDSVRVLGIADPSLSLSGSTALGSNVDPNEVIAAMRWESGNPWARFSEWMAGHPLVIHRIAALQTSGLPGAPTRWNAEMMIAAAEGPDLVSARRRFWIELPVRYVGWAALLLLIVMLKAHVHASQQTLAALVLVAGVTLLVRGMLMNSLREPQPIDRISSLLARMDAGPVTGIPVSIRGKITGRGFPGYILSPDLVVTDESGFVTAAYNNPIPFARTKFSIANFRQFAEEEVYVEGWYRRTASPFLEISEETSGASRPG